MQENELEKSFFSKWIKTALSKKYGLSQEDIESFLSEAKDVFKDRQPNELLNILYAKVNEAQETQEITTNIITDTTDQTQENILTDETNKSGPTAESGLIITPEQLEKIINDAVSEALKNSLKADIQKPTEPVLSNKVKKGWGAWPIIGILGVVLIIVVFKNINNEPNKKNDLIPTKTIAKTPEIVDFPLKINDYFLGISNPSENIQLTKISADTHFITFELSGIPYKKGYLTKSENEFILFSLTGQKICTLQQMSDTKKKILVSTDQKYKLKLIEQ